MGFSVRIFCDEDVPAAQRALAEARFRSALEQALGDSDLVWPCYLVYRKLFERYADSPRPWPVTPAEQVLVEQWEAAELAATHAAFGTHRYLGDADFELFASTPA